MLLLLLFATAAIPSAGQNASGTINNDGVCECSVFLPDNTFPVQRMEYLEKVSWMLNISVQQEIRKVQEYERILSVHAGKLLNLTQRVESIETGGSYTQLDFELLKLEIRELVSLTNQLKVTVNGSNVIIDQLYKEIQNMSHTVSQLESYDKLNVLAIRREIASLRKRLSDCEENQASSNPRPVDYGSCNHRGLLNITEPFIVQLNWRKENYKFGAWGKDPSPLPAKNELYFVAPLENVRVLYTFQLYSTYDNLLLNRNPISKRLPNQHLAQGSGMVLYNNTLYYNCYNSRDICGYNVDTGAVERHTLANAAFNDRFSYQGVKYQDIDFAVDEMGLWVIYSTDQNAGNIIIGKINITSFSVERTWLTKQFKSGVTNTFMICGVLYAIRPISTHEEEIFYTFDTRTGEEGKIAIKMEKLLETFQSVSYNPSDHKLYAFSDGYEVTYDVLFKPFVQPSN
ncbi:olfactomedin-4-like [Narcine bancroftii]|uniref:olfactomedin-4-like n=1 Tax=Narcine bancroftii TaxID=1343680 RepID=UPI0038315873